MADDRDPRNQNRLDLYRRLLSKIQEQDQASGAQGYILHWDDPDAEYDEAEIDPTQMWDAIGVSPILRESARDLWKESSTCPTPSPVFAAR